LPIRFSELANTTHSPLANAQANALALPFAKANGKWRMKGECIGRPMARPMQNNPLPFSAYMRHRQGKPRKAPGGLLSSGPRSRGCTGSSAHLDRRWSGRVGRHQPIDRQQQVSMF